MYLTTLTSLTVISEWDSQDRLCLKSLNTELVFDESISGSDSPLCRGNHILQRKKQKNCRRGEGGQNSLPGRQTMICKMTEMLPVTSSSLACTPDDRKSSRKDFPLANRSFRVMVPNMINPCPAEL